MTAYQTIVVGTDGSEPSLKAVDRAAAVAGDTATLIIACAYFPDEDKNVAAASDALKSEAYQVHGSAPTDGILRTAAERATASGAKNVERRPVIGAPVDALLKLAADSGADLLVVGNRGLNSIAGRVLGSVPADVSRKTKSDVLIVHTYN